MEIPTRWHTLRSRSAFSVYCKPVRICWTYCSLTFPVWYVSSVYNLTPDDKKLNCFCECDGFKPDRPLLFLQVFQIYRMLRHLAVYDSLYLLCQHRQNLIADIRGSSSHVRRHHNSRRREENIVFLQRLVFHTGMPVILIG